MDGCLIITGTPGAGKTTVSKLVAERLERSARIDLDVLAQLMVSGGAPCSVANNFAEAGFTAMMDTVVETREELEFLAGRLSVRPLMLVVLAPSLEIAQRRNATRPKRDQVDYDFTHTAATVRREIGNVGWWLGLRGLDGG